MGFKAIWLFVTGSKESLVTDVAISCVVTWETVMQPKNYDLFLLWILEER